MRQPKLGQEEWDILRHVADHAPATVREVADHFAQTKGLARTTVLTVMERLRTKRFLRRRKSGGVYRYSPSAPPGELAQGMVASFVETRLQGVIAPFLAYLSDSANVSDEELAELKSLVRDLEQQRRGVPRQHLFFDGETGSECVVGFGEWTEPLARAVGVRPVSVAAAFLLVSVPLDRCHSSA